MPAWEFFTSQKQWEEYIKDLLRTNDKALLRAIVCIYDNQTDEEKVEGKSIEDNCAGFSKFDAHEMTVIAMKVKRGKQLTKGELAKSRNKMQKYWKQLMVISKRNAEAKRLQMQKELDEKLNDEEHALLIEEHERLELFRQHNEIIRQCFEEGKMCEYGICSECHAFNGLQVKMNL